MKYFAVYMLLRLGGYQEPSVNNIRIVISSVGIFMDGDTAAAQSRLWRVQNSRRLAQRSWPMSGPLKSMAEDSVLKL